MNMRKLINTRYNLMRKLRFLPGGILHCYLLGHDWYGTTWGFYPHCMRCGKRKPFLDAQETFVLRSCRGKLADRYGR